MRMMRLWLLLVCVACVGFVQGQEDALEFIVVGDWGETLLPGQQRVADRMAEWAEEHPPRFIASTGDNFYPNGVQSADSVQFDTKWRDVYLNHTSLKDVPWYLSVGNHDYRWEEWAQVDFSYIEERWIFPNLWHSDVFQAGDSTLHLVMIDTEALRENENDPDSMLEWLDEELAGSEADYKLVMGHRHIYSSGDYGPVSGTNYDVIRPIMEEHNTDMFVCGHDHSLQLMVDSHNRDTIDYVVSAGGGALTYPYSEEAEEILESDYNITTILHARTWGFTSFIVTTDQIQVDFWDDEGANLLSYVRPRKDWSE